MKKSAAITIPVLFMLFGYVCVEEAFCRGGRGGGFGAGNMGGSYSGAARSGGASHRSPSMSSHTGARSSGSVSRQASSGNISSRPQRSQGSVKKASEGSRAPAAKPASGSGARPAARPGGPGSQKPSQAQVQQFLDLPKQQGSGGLTGLEKVGVGAAVGTLGYAGAQHLLGSERPGGGDRIRPGTLPVDRPGAGQRPSSIDRPANLPSSRNAERIRDNVQGRYDNVFTPQWWKDHPQMAQQYWNNFGKYQFARNHWWRPATWAGVTGWIVGASAAYGASPAYYDYGETIYYEGDQVYEGGKPIATAEQYYQQAVSLASSAVSKPPKDEEWLPLGVFAIAAGQSTDSNMMLQLAVNKQGVIQGTYQNTTTDTARPVRGMVDKKTQRAAWTFADGKNTDIIMETGLFNLTQDQAEALVHFGKDKTQQWLMVRLPQPVAEKGREAS